MEPKNEKKNPPAAKTVTPERMAAKAEAFGRLAPTRTGDALAAIAKLERLASKVSYEYTDAQKERILGAVDGAVASLRKSFDTGKLPSSARFTL